MITLKRIVILCGWRSSGKDLFGNYLTQPPQNYKRFAFGDALKDECASKYGVPRNFFDDRDKKDTPLLQTSSCFRNNGFNNNFSNKTPRDLCIEWAAVRRKENSRYWIDKIIGAMRRVFEGRESRNESASGRHGGGDDVSVNLFPGGCVITDCRYQLEIDAIREVFKNDVVSVWIRRFEEPPSLDPSEHAICEKDCDQVLNNYQQGPPKQTFQEFLKLIEEKK